MRQEQIKRRPAKRDTRDATTDETPRRPDHADKAARDAGETLCRIDRALGGAR
jgi:hypothetical protein